MRDSTPSPSNRTRIVQDPPQALLAAPGVARALSISVRQVWRLAAAGKLPTVRIDGSTRFAVDDIEAFIASRRRTSGRRSSR